MPYKFMVTFKSTGETVYPTYVNVHPHNGNYLEIDHVTYHGSDIKECKLIFDVTLDSNQLKDHFKGDSGLDCYEESDLGPDMPDYGPKLTFSDTIEHDPDYFFTDDYEGLGRYHNLPDSDFKTGLAPGEF